MPASTSTSSSARARKAEENGIAFAFVADGLYINEKSIPHFPQPLRAADHSVGAGRDTSKIGLAGTVSTSYSDPFTVARQFASLDLISGGRAGWNVVTSPLEGSGRNYGRAHPEHALRYEIADEYLEIVQGLWDSWDDDAFVRDREAGRFFDREKLHTLGHKGKFFQVEGPLNIQRSPQGQPVIFQAGASDAGIGLAGRKYADAVFTHAPRWRRGRSSTQQGEDQRDCAGPAGRRREDLPGIGPIVGRTEKRPRRSTRRSALARPIDDALAYLGRFFDHHDFSPVRRSMRHSRSSARSASNSFRSTTDRIKRTAALKRQTLREAALEAATPRADLIGSAQEIADILVERVEKQAADGFILGFPVIGQGLDDFVELVIPVLEDRGVYDRNLPGETLRDHLGLPRRESRYARSAPASVPRKAG
jgi:FMN-dependent oxidoreductase (nitrilotriacetate monooxygenase family)